MLALAARPAVALAKAGQQRAPASMEERVRALAQAGDDAAAREKALQAFDSYPLSNLTTIGFYAERQGAAAKEAVRRWLPHRAWIANLPGTIGDARRKESELFGPDPKREPDGFARAVQGLLDRKDAATRVLALRLLKSLPLRDPSKLLGFLEGDDRALKRAAAEALVGRLGPDAAGRVLPCFIAGGPETDAAVGRLLASIAGPEEVPALLELVEFNPLRAPEALRVMGAAGDASAEPGLLAFLEKTGDRNLAGAVVDVLALVGTRASIEPVRKFRDALPPDDPKRASCRQALLALRDPALRREMLEDLRTGRADLRSLAADLERLGVREAVPLLVERAKGRLRIEERNKLFGSLGRLGGPGEVDLIVPYLDDERHVEAAAAALLELGDPRAAAPLARALRMADGRSAVARALLLLPPPFEGVEEPLLEILDDPDGHGSFEDALRVAGRSGSARLKEKVLACIADRGSGTRSWTTVWEILPLLRPEDREALLRHKPEGKPNVNNAFLLALAGTGDAEALRTLLGQAAGQRLSLRHPYEPDRMLELSGMAAAVEETFKAGPAWAEGAEWLALHGNASGAGLLRDQLKAQPGREPVNAARALLRLRDPEARDALVAYYERSGPGELPVGAGTDERDFARSLDDASAARLRDSLSMPFPNRSALRLLAHRADPVALALFRSQVRIPAGFGTDEAQVGPALAGAGAVSLRPDFLRMLRSPSASRRITGARCLGLLGDPAALPALVPLLDDLQADLGVGRRPDRLQPALSIVADAAAEAIERLAGRTFGGPRAKRIEAIRAWARDVK